MIEHEARVGAGVDQFRSVVQLGRAHAEIEAEAKLAEKRKEYPKAEAANPSVLAEKVRANLTDAKRSLRIYGSEVVIGRLLAQNGSARLYLINYQSGHRAVEGIRVRVAGDYSKHSVSAYDAPGRSLMDYGMKTGAIEFTLPELKTYAVVDLTR